MRTVFVRKTGVGVGEVLKRVPAAQKLNKGSGSSQKDPLEAVGGDAVLVLRLGVALRVRAAGRTALGGAQVVHEGQPVLPAEVDEFDVAHARVEVHTWTEPRVGTKARQDQTRLVFTD